MSLRPSSRAEVRKKGYKIGVDADEARLHREDNLVEIRKNKREDNLLQKRREGLPITQQSQLFPLDSIDIAKQYYKKGAQVEISSTDDLLNGSWYTGNVIRPPIGKSSGVVVEYATLSAEGRPVREFLDLEQLRPLPPQENHIAFNIDDFVDAYHKEGWWEGFITQMLGRDEYIVSFPRTKEKLPFKASQLRLHRDWIEVNGMWEWDPPLEERPNDDKIPFSAEVESCRDAVEHQCSSGEEVDHQFCPGDEVEVSLDDEGFEGAWFSATVKKINRGKYLIEYHSLMNDDDTDLLREEVDELNMRPPPPDIGLVDRFDLHEEVDAWYNDAWWAGMISKVLKNDRYCVYFRSTDEELKFEHSKLRIHQDWKDGKWHINSKVVMR